MTKSDLYSHESDEKLFKKIFKTKKDSFDRHFLINDDSLFKARLQDFNLISKIGFGAFATVILASHKITGEFYAVKALKKKDLVKLKQVEHCLNEKRILQYLKHPFLIRMVYYCTDNAGIYFVLPYIKGGDLFSYLMKYKKFEEDVSKFFGGQILLALEYLHYLNIVYRDLKPENVLIDINGYIKLTDFGFAKIVNGRTYTICGTPEYIAPEIILMKGYGISVDWWAFGILLYEINSGQVPFRDKGNQLKLYGKIVEGKFPMIKSFSAALEDLIGDLLEVNISSRIGCLRNGPMDIKKHRWFEHINWMQLYNKKSISPFNKSQTNIPIDNNQTYTFSDMEDFDDTNNIFKDF